MASPVRRLVRPLYDLAVCGRRVYHHASADDNAHVPHLAPRVIIEKDQIAAPQIVIADLFPAGILGKSRGVIPSGRRPCLPQAVGHKTRAVKGIRPFRAENILVPQRLFGSGNKCINRSLALLLVDKRRACLLYTSLGEALSWYFGSGWAVSAFSHIHVTDGDMTKPLLGMSGEIAEKAATLIHAAAVSYTPLPTAAARRNTSSIGVLRESAIASSHV